MYKIRLHSTISQLNHLSLGTSPHCFIIQIISHFARSFSLLVPQPRAWELEARPPIQLLKVLEPAVNQRSTGMIWCHQLLQMWSRMACEDLIGQEKDPKVTWCITTSQHSKEAHWSSISSSAAASRWNVSQLVFEPSYIFQQILTSCSKAASSTSGGLGNTDSSLLRVTLPGTWLQKHISPGSPAPTSWRDEPSDTGAE